MITAKQIDRKLKNKVLALTESLEDEVNKETWQDEKPVEKDYEISTESDEMPEDNMSPMDLITKRSEENVEESEITDQMENQFQSLTNEEKKELLLKLVKNDMDIDRILKEYLNSKCPIEEDDEEKKQYKIVTDYMPPVIVYTTRKQAEAWAKRYHGVIEESCKRKLKESELSDFEKIVERARKDNMSYDDIVWLQDHMSYVKKKVDELDPGLRNSILLAVGIA